MYRIREHSDDGVPYLIDNREGTPSLASVLRLLMASGEWADIATGYLSLGGYRMLANELETLRDFRLLFGKNHITDELARELRGERYRAATRALVERLITFLHRDGVALRRYTGDFFHAKAYILRGAAIVGSSNFTANGLTGNTELNDELHEAIDQLRTRLQSTVDLNDESAEAEQSRRACVEAIGRLVDTYTAMRQPDTKPIEDRLEIIFGPYWSDAYDPRGLPENVRNMLISGDFVYYEFSKGGVADWAASAVQYVRAVEHELHRRLYDRFGQPSPLQDRNGYSLSPRGFTFGTVTHAYHNRTHHNHNWNVFLSRAVAPSGSTAGDFQQAIHMVAGLHSLRNQIAHSEPIDQVKAQRVRDISLGNTKTSLASALRQFISLLDA